ncbi:MAG: response regulator [Anaerolineales bacterium]|nr:response regulator [Anaerolineales bacterium]
MTTYGPKAHSILVVDDDAEIRQLLCALLQFKGFRTRQARDGQDALEKIAADKPDLVLLDIMMPRLDGISACKQLRQAPETAALPVIMFSGKGNLEAVREGLAAGANHYLAKPIGLEELEQCIIALLAPTPNGQTPT